MDETRIILSGLWVALMLVYLLGDVLRIFAGDFEPGAIEGKEVGSGVYLGMAAIMLIPIVMVVVTLTVPFPAVRWTVIGVATFQLLFNLVGLPYPGVYDNFLIVVSFVIDAAIIWYAWTWVA